MHELTENHIRQAAELIHSADSLIITAGAGMGVDSGLPDFRGQEGFWKAYPALAKAQIGFTDIACPDTFADNPKLAWGFYGHRLNLYRKTEPHKGFKLLRAITNQLDGGAFVFTSNVDGHFQKSGFPLNSIVECHGSIHHLQCLQGCNQEIWEATKFIPEVDEEHCLLTSPFPTCRHCGGIARPNILMFGDWQWVSWRTEFQRARFYELRETVSRPVVIEIGAGQSIPTVREFGERQKAPLIRINLSDAAVNRPGDVALQMGGLEAIAAISKCLVDMDFIEKAPAQKP
ncbi:NAD-dependent protein deacylase Sir2 [Methylophilaceae bacterium]|nr:NAD-dependent protein deacylase Sir2 [Methylophilaceae bacterium]